MSTYNLLEKKKKKKKKNGDQSAATFHRTWTSLDDYHRKYDCVYPDITLAVEQICDILVSPNSIVLKLYSAVNMVRKRFVEFAGI